jgi:Trk K+ transport system NAD-binding subunit
MFDRIVLVGAGKTSGSIVERLARIAPLTIVDTSAAALDVVSTRDLQAVDTVHPIVKKVADGTSRLVLADLRGDPRTGVGLVVAPGDDRAALESCRLAAALDFKPMIAIVNDREIAHQCEEHGARALLRAELVGQLVEQSLLHGGVGVSSAVGFGRGEILEFMVLPSSRAIGIPLAKLPAVGWRVAAIYRGKELVLPTGATTIAADDRVLVIGDPKQLPHVAELLRVGIPTFPLLHGPNVVVYLPGGRDGGVETEAEVVLKRTRASAMIRVYPGAPAARKVIETPSPDGTTARKRVEDAPLEGDDLARHVEALRAKQPGVLVMRPRSRVALDVLFGRGGDAAVLCNEIGVPVLFPRGSAHHERILFCVTDGAIDLGVAEVALDLARMFAVPLVVLRAKLPSYLQATESATEKLVDTISERARLYGVNAEVRVVEGNPISEWVRASTPQDLSIVSRPVQLRDSFSKPDLALRVARQSKGSVLVITVKR